MHLNAPHFHDEEAALAYLENIVWPDGNPVCPHCGCPDRVYSIKANPEKKVRPGLKKCGECRKQFTVTVNTVMHGTRIPVHKWLLAAYLMAASKKGISAKQMERMTGLTYKSAWFMMHRLREALRHDGTLLGEGGGVVEADETFWGNNKKRHPTARAFHHKMKIMGLVERGGNVRSFPIPTVTGRTLQSALRKNVDRSATIHTDEHKGYKKTKKTFAGHETVNHSDKEYARGDVTTNTIEGYFSLLKRGLIGTFHSVGEQHLHRYCREFDYRYNTRKTDDVTRADGIMARIYGKRLQYAVMA